jgi:hypothetical protein
MWIKEGWVPWSYLHIERDTCTVYLLFFSDCHTMVMYGLLFMGCVVSFVSLFVLCY